MSGWALALCAVATLAAAAPQARAAPEPPAAERVTAEGLAGAWAGAIEPLEGDPVEVTITLERTAEGAWTGTIAAPAWQAEAAPLEALSVTTGGVRFSAGGLLGAPDFVGVLSADGSQISGNVSHDPPPPPPASDIHLIELDTAGPVWKLGVPINITDRDGYDNQPRFLPDGTALFYTSIRDGQADVYRYDVDSRQSVRLTETGESEYSPTPLPSGDGFSTVRVEEGGIQRLWRFGAGGGDPDLLLPEIAPVGYHGWLDERRLGLFVLGTPPTLEIADVELQTHRAVAENVGRSIHRTPDGQAVSFVSKASESGWTIDRLELESGERRTLIAARPGSEDFVWAPGGHILMGEGSALFAFAPGGETEGWREVADLSAHGIYGITRLDVSPDGRRLAVVGARPTDGTAERVSSPFTLRRSR